MKRERVCIANGIVLAAIGLAFCPGNSAGAGPSALQAGFGEADITPPLTGKPVYIAGYGNNRKAIGIHDPLMARAIVLREGKKKLAIVSIDVVGFSYPRVQALRNQLKDFTYVLVSSTHNHEGPDTLGLWGPSHFVSGVDPEYMKLVDGRILEAVHAADVACQPSSCRIGQARAPELLYDGREPYVKHDEMTVIAVENKAGLAGLVVAWNCHPETLGSRNTLVSADYVGYTVTALRNKHHCPVVYLTGTVGGLMTTLHVPIRDAKGRQLKEESYEKTARYGDLLADVANRALRQAEPLPSSPLEVRTKLIYPPVDNAGFRLARQIGVFSRAAFLTGGEAPAPAPAAPTDKRLLLQTEVGWIKLGDLEIAAIPGEIYPELVLGKVQDPVDPGADFPDAPIEPAIYAQLHGRYKMLIGLANDEIGYIIPKRQWDAKPPFCYGRKQSQYGEINSLGPDTAPVVCEGFQALTR